MNKSWALNFAGALLLCSAWPMGARSDQPVDVLRVLCISEPELTRFSVHSEIFYNFSPPQSYKNLLEKYGLVIPQGGFAYTCQLAKTNYKISGTLPTRKATGACGGDPRIRFSLEKDEKAILQDVFMTPSCLPRTNEYLSAYIESFNVVESNYSEIFLLLNDGIKTIPVSYWSLVERGFKKPITQKTIDCFAKEKIAESYDRALEKCNANIPENPSSPNR